MYEFENGSSEWLFGKILCYKFYTCEVFHLYVSIDGFSGCSCHWNIFCTFHKHEVFQLYMSWDGHSSNLWKKILYYIFYKYNVYCMNVIGYGYPRCLSLSNPCWIIHRELRKHCEIIIQSVFMHYFVARFPKYKAFYMDSSWTTYLDHLWNVSP